ncbi:MAG: UvrD-helicase domain-containing protein, partial [Pyramidobacter sp.]|nr:UvrD-helicase domain-containing protein [Pyramidobacter sp.]
MTESNDLLKGLNDAQREAVCYTGTPQLVLAGAGSGKTRVLTTKIAWLINQEGVAPWRILAVTFTNKAAREMSERVDKLLGASRGGAQICTFHSFGLNLLFRNR